MTPAATRKRMEAALKATHTVAEACALLGLPALTQPTVSAVAARARPGAGPAVAAAH